MAIIEHSAVPTEQEITLKREIASRDRNEEMKQTIAMLMCSYHRAAVAPSGTQVHWDNVTSDASTKDKTTEAPIYLDESHS